MLFVTTFLLLCSYFIVLQMYSAIEKSLEASLDGIATLQALRIDSYIENNYENLTIISGETQLKAAIGAYQADPSDVAREHIKALLSTAVEANDEFVNIMYLDTSGKLIAEFAEDKLFDFKSIVTSADIETPQTNYVVEGNKPFFYITGPIYNDGVLAGTLVIKENDNEIIKITKDYTSLGSTGEIIIAKSNPEGGIVYLHNRRFEQAVAKQDMVSNAKNPMSHALSGKNSYFSDLKDYKGKKVLAVTKHIEVTGWGLILQKDRSEGYRPIYIAEFCILVFALIVWVMVFFIVKWIFREVFRPIDKLQHGIAQIDAGDLSFRFNDSRTDEFGVLSNAFDNMATSIRRSRSEIDKKVQQQTGDIRKQKQLLEDQQAAVLNILEDIEEEKDNAESLAKDLEKYMLAVAGVSDHIVITDAEGIILYANKAVETITGFAVDDIIGKKAGSKELWGGNMEKDIYVDFWKTIKIDKKPFSGVFRNKRKDGREYDASAHVSPILDKKGGVIYFVGIERDVTRELDIDRAKTEFVSLASHQLRTPLSAINWYTEMLLDGDAGKINKEQREYLNEIYKGNKRMVALVSALLNVSRLDLGTFQIEPSPIKLCEVVDDVANEMKHMMEEKKITFSNMCPIDNPSISADPKLLRIIIQNLLSNAVKYTPDGGKISVSMTYSPKSIKEAFVIKVTDNGYGIPEKQKDKIFTKLFRADNVRALDTEGTGLGLYIIKSIMEESGGQVGFESKEGKGTTFTVTIPKEGMKQKAGEKELELKI